MKFAAISCTVKDVHIYYYLMFASIRKKKGGGDYGKQAINAKYISPFKEHSKENAIYLRVL